MLKDLGTHFSELFNENVTIWGDDTRGDVSESKA